MKKAKPFLLVLLLFSNSIFMFIYAGSQYKGCLHCLYWQTEYFARLIFSWLSEKHSRGQALSLLFHREQFPAISSADP